MGEWQPIETAPKDGTNVILYCSHGGWAQIEIGSFRNDENDRDGDDPCWLDNSFDYFSCGYASCPLYPTHWMPLPEPPKK